MGEFAEAAESVVMASEDAASADLSPADTPDAPPVAPDPASPEPAPSVPAEASAQTTSEERRGPDGRFQRPSKGDRRYQELANQNRTYKTENERLKKLEQDFGWLTPDHAPVMKSFYERYQQDSVGALAAEILHQAKSPQHRARIQQELRELLAEQAQPEAAKPDVEPQPDYETDDGEKVYSAKRQADWMAWRERQWTAKLHDELAPLRTLAQETQEARVHAHLSQQAEVHAQSVVGPLLQNPLFVQHRPAIRAQYRAIVHAAKAAGQEVNGEVALYRAFSTVLATAAAQQRTTTDRATVASLHAKRGASALNPARPVAAAPAARPTTFGEAAAKVLNAR